MDSEDNKISIRQVVVIFLIAIASPIIRVIPRYCAEIAQEASWLTPIFSTVAFMILLFVLNKIMGKNTPESLEDIICKVFGKVIGTILTYIYILWFIIMLSVYLRYFADRITASIFVFTPNKFFIATMLFVIYIVLRKDIKFFARYIEFFLLIFIIFLCSSFFIAIPSINISNLFPVTTNDFGKIALSALPLLAVQSFITYLFFLGDKISNKQEFKSHIKKILATVVLTSVMVILLTIGIFGCKLTQDLNLPFFIFFKNIEILGIIERIESVLITFWVVTDFCIITMFGFVAIKLIKKTLKLSSTKQIVTPLLFFSYVLSMFIASSQFEMVSLSQYVLIPVNLILGMGMPIVLLIVGKIRKKI